MDGGEYSAAMDQIELDYRTVGSQDPAEEHIYCVDNHAANGNARHQEIQITADKKTDHSRAFMVILSIIAVTSFILSIAALATVLQHESSNHNFYSRLQMPQPSSEMSTMRKNISSHIPNVSIESKAQTAVSEMTTMRTSLSSHTPSVSSENKATTAAGEIIDTDRNLTGRLEKMLFDQVSRIDKLEASINEMRLREYDLSSRIANLNETAEKRARNTNEEIHNMERELLKHEDLIRLSVANDNATQQYISVLEEVKSLRSLIITNVSMLRDGIDDVRGSMRKLNAHVKEINKSSESNDERIRHEIRIINQTVTRDVNNTCKIAKKKCDDIRAEMTNETTKLAARFMKLIMFFGNSFSTFKSEMQNISSELTARVHELERAYENASVIHHQNGTEQEEDIIPVKLVGGVGVDEQTAGRVEVLYNGTWGTICHDSWGKNDGDVVCIMLGFSRGARDIYQSARYGEGTGKIWLDDLECRGTESSLWECPHSGWGIHNCGHHEDASVACDA